MATALLTDQEFVVHCFAPLDGPQAAAASAQVRQTWLACRERLGLTEPIAGTEAPALLPEVLGGVLGDDVIAAQQSPGGDAQSVLRRVHDVLNLSVALAGPGRGWPDSGQTWAEVRPSGPGVLGEARLFLAKVRAAGGPVVAGAELGQSVDPDLAGWPDRAPGWWRAGTTTEAGFALWDTGRAADTGAVRELVLFAAADRDEEMSAWAWSDGTAEIPPLARYLLYAAKLRYEARLLESWHRRPAAGDLDALGAILAPGAPGPRRTALLQPWADRLRGEEVRLTALMSDLARLRETTASARHNLGLVPGCAAAGAAAAGAAGVFAADRALARWLTEQAGDDLAYAEIDLGQVRDLRAQVADELSQTSEDQTSRSPDAGPDLTRNVFVVYGRDAALTQAFFDLLRRVGLCPLEWETLVKATSSTAPYLGQVVETAPRVAQATLVLLTPDDLVELHSDLRLADDVPSERERGMQPRPNVLVELGMALMAHPGATIIVAAGQTRPIADLAGLNVIRFDGSAIAIKKIIERLKLAGCAVDDSGTDWLDPDRFADLAAERRTPDTHLARDTGGLRSLRPRSATRRTDPGGTAMGRSRGGAEK
jgi:predicted nucleotide-binding protein